MRSSIARGGLALLTVAALTGCGSSTWSPTWWNPFHTTSNAPGTSGSSLASAPPRPSTLATAPGSYAGGTSNAPYSQYGAATPAGYGSYPSATPSYGQANAGPYAPAQGQAGQYGAATPQYATQATATTQSPYGNSPYGASGVSPPESRMRSTSSAS